MVPRLLAALCACGVLNTLSGYSFTQDDADYVTGLKALTTKVNPSFFKLTAGLSIRFGN